MHTDDPSDKKIYVTDANVFGPAVELARSKHGLQVIRDQDLNLECDLDDYDQCLFDYAMEHGYVLVTGNIKDFEPKYYEYAATHETTPGIIFIQPNHSRSAELIAEWLALWEDEDLTNTVKRIPPP